MKINYAYLGAALLAAAGVLVGAYQLGQQQGVVPSAGGDTTATTQENAAHGMPASSHGEMMKGDAEGGPRFSHFRVGNRNVKSMYADGKYIWVGTSGGVIRYDTESDDYQLFNNKNSGLLSNGIFHVSKVGARMVIGTYGGGLSLYDPYSDHWENVNIPQGLADQFVYDVLQASSGDVWIATWSGANRVRGGNFANPEAWETFTVENTDGGLPNPWVYNVAEGNNGDIWFATEGGLALYRNKRWSHWQHEDGLGAAHEVVADSIQFKNDPAKASQHHARQKDEQGLGNVKDAYNPNYVISMAVDKSGGVWCGTWGAGLAYFDGKTWRNYTTKDDLPGNHVFMLYLDDKEQLWIGTNQGLARFNKGQDAFEVKTVADGLFAGNVFSMTRARDGSLWVGSFGGVAHIENAWE